MTQHRNAAPKHKQNNNDTQAGGANKPANIGYKAVVQHPSILA